MYVFYNLYFHSVLKIERGLLKSENQSTVQPIRVAESAVRPGALRARLPREGHRRQPVD